MNFFKTLCILSAVSLPLLSDTMNTEIRLTPEELESQNSNNASLIDTLSIKIGPSFAQTSQTDDQGGVTGVVEPDDSGVQVGVRLVFNNGYIPYFKPYIDMTSIIYSDRDIIIPSIGLRHDFELEQRWIEPYASFGVGYAVMDRTESPLSSSVAYDDSTSSANLTLEGGVDFYLDEHWALDLSLRYDTYNLKTTVGGNFQLTTIEDKSSVGLMGGLVYRFGSNDARKDDDLDGVKNFKDYCPKTPSSAQVDGYGCAQDEDKDGVIDRYDECPNTPYGAPVDEKGCALDSDGDGVIDLIDQCPDTLKGVPVNEAGCPQYKFDLSLSYAFNKKTVHSLLEKPSFNIVAFLKKHENYKVRLTGYADNIGSEKANNKISKERALSAKAFLMQQGISQKRIRIYSRGKHEGLFDNKTFTNRRKNRRIYIELYRTDKQVIIMDKAEQ